MERNYVTVTLCIPCNYWLIGCSETRTVSARLVYSDAAVYSDERTPIRELELVQISSVGVL